MMRRGSTTPACTPVRIQTRFECDTPREAWKAACSRFQTVGLATFLACTLFFPSSPAGAAVQEGAATTTPSDPEHALVQEALAVVDDHFIDLKNAQGVADSHARHTYNGVDWKALQAAEDKKKLKDRGNSYKDISGALKKLGDKYTRFVKPDDFAKLTKYDVTGVGVLIVEKEGQLYVGAPPLAGSTASEADVKKGDRIVSIDGVSMVDKTSFEGAEQLQAGGQLGSKVTLSLLRESDSNRKIEVKLERRISVGNPVSSSIVTAKNGNKVGYMKMTEFNAACKRGIADAVKEMKKEKVDDYVIDLRGNLGGVLDGALQIAALFLEQLSSQKTTLVYVMDNSGAEEAVWLKSRNVLDKETPITIILDSRSASASEVLAGALRDNCRATIVGKEKSFGKGLIQGAFPLTDGSGVIVTVASYITPKHVAINGIGLSPDLKIDLGDATKAIKSGKLDLDKSEAVQNMCVPPLPDDGTSSTSKLVKGADPEDTL